jgi:hypothetical protein
MWGLTATLTQEELIVDAICANYGYTSGVKADFADSILLKFINDNVIKYRMDNAEPDRVQVKSDAEAEMEGISI